MLSRAPLALRSFAQSPLSSAALSLLPLVARFGCLNRSYTSMSHKIYIVKDHKITLEEREQPQAAAGEVVVKVTGPASSARAVAD